MNVGKTLGLPQAFFNLVCMHIYCSCRTHTHAMRLLRFLLHGKALHLIASFCHAYSILCCYVNRSFLPAGKCRDTLYMRIQSMVAKRGLTNQPNVYTPMRKSRLKYSTAAFQSIQQFWLQFDICS